MRRRHRPSVGLLVALAFLAGAARAQSKLFSDSIHRVAPAEERLFGPFVAGDFDGDGDADVLNELGLLTNDGCAVFAPSACSYPAAAWWHGVAAGDVDGDQDLDVLRNTSMLWLNDGHGCFVDASDRLPNTSASGKAGFGILGDVDGDGDLDGLVATFGTDCADGGLCDYGEIRVYRNDGTGQFADTGLSVDPLAVGHPRALALGDVDADRDLDLFVANMGAGGASVRCKLLLNDGQGAFATTTHAIPLAYVPEGYAGAEFADLDGDGDLDLVFSANHLWWNRGDGEFVDGSQALGSLYTLSFAALGDVEPDGDADLVHISIPGTDRLLRNDGFGAFEHEPEAFALASEDAHFELVDLDSDGDLDALAQRDALEIHLYDQRGFFAWRAPLLPERGAFSSVHALGDVDGDHDVDVFVTSYGHDQLMLNDTNGAFRDASRNVPFESDWGKDAAFADVEGDGDLDLFVANGNTGSDPPAPSQLLLNDGLGSFTAAPEKWSAPDDAVRRVLCGDFDGDRDADVLGLGAGWNRARLYFNDGLGNYAEQAGAGPDVDWDGLVGVLADLDGDGDLDAVWGAHGARVFLNDGAGKLVATTDVLLSGLGMRCIATADLDGDGDSDLVGAVANQAVWTLFNDGHASFTKSSSAIGGPDVFAIASGDVDGDGDADLMLNAHGNGPIRLFLNDGSGDFADGSAAMPPVPLGSGPVSLADTDEDGDLDAVVGGASARSRLLVNLTRHLAWHEPPRVGKPVLLDVWGASDQSFVLLGATQRAREPLGSIGVLHLDRSTVFGRAAGTLDASGQAQVAIDVPAELALAGRSLYWQALLRSPDRLTNLEITTFDPESLH